VDPFHQEGSRFLPAFLLVQGADLFDEGIGVAGNHLGHAIIVPECAIISRLRRMILFSIKDFQ
jgi:hypothetical protein